MGDFFSTDSTPSKPSTARFYEGITLLFGNPKKEFPQNFDPARPFKTKLLGRVSREGFVGLVKSRNEVVPLEKFLDNPTKLKVESPLDCELRDNATYIVVHPTPPIPERYTNITLIWGNPEENFPDDFDYQDPFGARVIDSVSRESFISRVKGEDCVAVLPLDNFLNFLQNPTAVILKEKTPEQVELRDNATFILLHSGEKGLMKRVSDVAAWQRNRTEAEERHLRSALVKMLGEENHTNVEPFCCKRVYGPDGKYKEVDAAAIADGCAMVAEHKHVMGSKGADQLRKVIAFIKKYRDQDEGNVSQFRNKRLIPVLAGATVTTNTESKDDMDNIVQSEGYRVYYTDRQYGDDPCSPFLASCDVCDTPAPSGSLRNGPAAPSAMPRRGGRSFLAPVRGSAMLVRPRPVNNRVAGIRLTC